MEPNLDLRMISDWKPLLTDDFKSFKSSWISPFYHDIPTQSKNLQLQETQVTKLFAFSWKTNMLQL